MQPVNAIKVKPLGNFISPAEMTQLKLLACIANRINSPNALKFHSDESSLWRNKQRLLMEKRFCRHPHPPPLMPIPPSNKLHLSAGGKFEKPNQNFHHRHSGSCFAGCEDFPPPPPRRLRSNTGFITAACGKSRSRKRLIESETEECVNLLWHVVCV